jgi:hypothetical protein
MPTPFSGTRPNGRTEAIEAVQKFYGLGPYDDHREPGDISDRPGPLNPVKGDGYFAASITERFGMSPAALRRSLGL